MFPVAQLQRFNRTYLPKSKELRVPGLTVQANHRKTSAALPSEFSFLPPHLLSAQLQLSWDYRHWLLEEGKRPSSVGEMI